MGRYPICYIRLEGPWDVTPHGVGPETRMAPSGSNLGGDRHHAASARIVISTVLTLVPLALKASSGNGSMVPPWAVTSSRKATARLSCR